MHIQPLNLVRIGPCFSVRHLCLYTHNILQIQCCRSIYILRVLENVQECIHS